MTCTHCHGELPRFPEKARAADGTEWEFCSWKCAVLWRAAFDHAAQMIAARMFPKESAIHGT